MAMEISNNYSNYAGGYTNTTNTKKKTAEISTSKEVMETNPSTRKTAADELSYLSKKYSNYSFVAADYTKGMQYGSSSTVNVAISPQFLSKMANDPELEKEYEKNIAAMQECDEQNARSVAAGGWHVVAQGWAVDKAGGISKWSVVQKDGTKSRLQTMSGNAEKIRKQNEEKKKEKAELEAKMKETGKAFHGGRFKDASVTIRDDKETDTGRNEKNGVGINLDMKI